MAAMLQQLQTKAVQASQFVDKHGTSYCKQLLKQNKQYIQEPSTMEMQWIGQAAILHSFCEVNLFVLLMSTL